MADTGATTTTQIPKPPSAIETRVGQLFQQNMESITVYRRPGDTTPLTQADNELIAQARRAVTDPGFMAAEQQAISALNARGPGCGAMSMTFRNHASGSAFMAQVPFQLESDGTVIPRPNAIPYVAPMPITIPDTNLRPDRYNVTGTATSTTENGYEVRVQAGLALKGCTP